MGTKRSGIKLTRRCEKCGRIQRKKALRTGTGKIMYIWDYREKCECGGNFVSDYQVIGRGKTTKK